MALKVIAEEVKRLQELKPGMLPCSPWQEVGNAIRVVFYKPTIGICFMGEAKRRGTFEQRQNEAVAALRNQFPEHVSCNNCQAELDDIQPMDVRGLSGMRLAGIAHCAACQHDTWVLDGTPEALEMFQSWLDSEHGAEAISVGVAKR